MLSLLWLNAECRLRMACPPIVLDVFCLHAHVVRCGKE